MELGMHMNPRELIVQYLNKITGKSPEQLDELDDVMRALLAQDYDTRTMGTPQFRGLDDSVLGDLAELDPERHLGIHLTPAELAKYMDETNFVGEYRIGHNQGFGHDQGM